MRPPEIDALPAPSAFEGAVKAWLLADDRLEESPEQFLHGLAEQFVDQGISLLSISVLIRTLHPQFEMLGLRWRPFEMAEIPTEETDHVAGQHQVPGARGVVDVYQVTHGHSQEAMYLSSPFHQMKITGEPIRYRFDDEGQDRPYAILDDLGARGATDYLALNVQMQSPFEAGMSFTTAQASGFPKGLEQDLRRSIPLIARVMGFCLERISFREILRAYLGPTAATQVLRGQVIVGQVQSLRAVIGFADLRGLRRQLSDLSERDHMEALSAFFTAAQAAVARAGGEILKLMGESVLFVVHLETEGAGNVRARALAAAQELTKAVTADAVLQNHDLTVSVGLHEGEVLLGNVGAPSRLDFTVLGEAVNLAARLQAMGGARAEPIVLSARLADQLDGDYRSLGLVALKGIEEPQEARVPCD